jgi:hypothetical protein
MDLRIEASARRALARVRERAVSVDLTLRFCGGLVTKEAVAYPGSEDEGAGFRREEVDDLLLYWRQRLVVDGLDPAQVTTAVVPRRLTVRAGEYQLAAEASYA